MFLVFTHVFYYFIPFQFQLLLTASSVFFYSFGCVFLLLLLLLLLLNSPAFVRRRLDTLEMEALTSNDNHQAATESKAAASSLLNVNLPPPTTCTVKFLVCMLLCHKCEVEASELLFDFYQVHPTLRTEESRIAVLEHYVRLVDDDETDGRESTRVLGALRRRSLWMLEQ